MTGQDYITNRHLHPFWDESRDPNREDVVDAFEQGKAEGAREMKDQMMKGAIYCVAHPDITVCGRDTDVPFIRLGSVALGGVGVKVGDAVKVIVIKED